MPRHFMWKFDTKNCLTDEVVNGIMFVVYRIEVRGFQKIGTSNIVQLYWILWWRPYRIKELTAEPNPACKI